MGQDGASLLEIALGQGAIGPGDAIAKGELCKRLAAHGVPEAEVGAVFRQFQSAAKKGQVVAGRKLQRQGRGPSTRYLATPVDNGPRPPASLRILQGDNLPILQGLADDSVDLVYIDPPFNTGRRQSLTRVRAVRSAGKDGHRGFQDHNYRTEAVSQMDYADSFRDFEGFLRPRLEEAKRILSPRGSLFFHIDYRESHYCKVLLDSIFGRRCFQNEIIWAYDYGARSKRKWSTKHDTIFWYACNPADYTFNFDEMDRIPYMAPGLVTPEKRARGKTPTDVWWHTIVPTNGKERTGYPTQKPLGVLERIIKVHSKPGDVVLDFFAGSGTTGEAALRLGRSCILIDENPEALTIMKKRLAFAEPQIAELLRHLPKI